MDKYSHLHIALLHILHITPYESSGLQHAHKVTVGAFTQQMLQQHPNLLASKSILWTLSDRTTHEISCPFHRFSLRLLIDPVLYVSNVYVPQRPC